MLYNLLESYSLSLIGEIAPAMIEFKVFILGLANNVAIILSLVMLYSTLLPHIKKLSLFNRNLFIGILFSMIAIIGMMMHIEIIPGVTQDSRLILVLSAGITGGPVAAIISAGLTSLFRVYMGGIGALAGIIGIIGSATIGSIFYMFFCDKIHLIKLRSLFPLSFVLVVNGLFGLLFLPLPQDEVWEIIRLVAVPELIFYTLGTFLLIMLIRNESIKANVESERVVFQKAIEQAADGFIITDENRNILYTNPYLEKISGFSHDDLYGNNVDFFNISASLSDKIREILDKEKEWIGNLKSTRKDGTTFEAEVSISRIHDKNGNITNSVVIARDMTEKNKLESMLRQAQKMESMGILAGGIAHDFNNILGAILGFTDLSLDDVEKGSSVERYLEQIKIGGNRAKHLVQQILLFSRRSKGPKVAIFIGPIVSEVCNLLKASLPSTILIESCIAKDTIPVLADSIKIHEIVMNLCTNAAHAMDERGILNLEYMDIKIEKSIAGIVDTIEPGWYSQISIKDNGEGIDNELREHIFDPFYTTKEVSEGTGLGLSVVYGIVKEHGGDILLNSVVGEGTEFKILLPKTHQELHKESLNIKMIRKGYERIMLVDDDVALCESTKEILTGIGYNVNAFTDSEKALDYFKSSQEKVDLVITDQTMPNLTGFEMALEMLDIRPAIPIILATGYSKHVSKDEALKMGIAAFIYKPYDKFDIANAIEKALDR